MFDGFIPGSRASTMLDVVAIAMAVVLPILVWSIRLVKVHNNHALHRKVQVVLGVVLLVTVALFEADMRIRGWRHLAKPSPYYDSWVFPALYVHLCFSISTTVLWAWVIIAALRRYERGTGFGNYAKRHHRLGWLAALGITGTAVTGWIFYILAFVA